MAQIFGCCKIKVAQFRKAEKDDKRMALKICMGVKLFIKVLIIAKKQDSGRNVIMDMIVLLWYP
jgi:hypothetical protein